ICTYQPGWKHGRRSGVQPPSESKGVNPCKRSLDYGKGSLCFRGKRRSVSGRRFPEDRFDCSGSTGSSGNRSAGTGTWSCPHRRSVDRECDISCNTYHSLSDCCAFVYLQKKKGCGEKERTVPG